MPECSDGHSELARQVSPSRLTSSSAMPFVVATEAHAIPERPPLSLASGDVVTVGRRHADWPAFVFVTTVQGSGWVPSRYLSADAGRAVVETPYNTTELATRSGEILEVIDRDDESGGCGAARRMVARAGFRAAALKQRPVPRAADMKFRPPSGNRSA